MTLKEEMIEFLYTAQLPLYFEEKQLIKEFIEKFEKIMGTGTISGHNPFDYYEREDEYYLHEKKQKKPENG